MTHTYDTATLIVVDCIHYNDDGTQDHKVKLSKKREMGCCNTCWNAHVAAWDEARATQPRSRRPLSRQ